MSYSLTKTDKKTNKKESFYKQDIHLHPITCWSYLRLAITEPHLHQGKPTALADSIAPAIYSSSWHSTGVSTPSWFSSAATSPSPAAQQHTLPQDLCLLPAPGCDPPLLPVTHQWRIRSNTLPKTVVPTPCPSTGEYCFHNRDYLKAARSGTPSCQTF